MPGREHQSKQKNGERKSNKRTTRDHTIELHRSRSNQTGKQTPHTSYKRNDFSLKFKQIYN
jgi:hypothetical protein